MKKLVILVVIVGVTVFGYEIYNRGGETPFTIKVGIIFPFTGNAASYGEAGRDGINLAVEAINKSGGVSGKNVEIMYEDSQFDPKTALNAYESLKARGTKHFLTMGSSVSVALEREVVLDHNLQFEVSAVTPLYRDGKVNTCRATLTADVSGVYLGNFIAKTLKAEAISFLTLNDEFGTAMRDNIKKAIVGSGVRVLHEESFGKSDGDFRTQITKIKADEAKTDALVIIAIGPQAEKVLTELKRFGWSKPIVSDNYTILNQNLKNLSLAEGVYISDYNWLLNNATDTVRFKQDFKSKYDYEAPAIAANAYDSAMILAEGLKATGEKNPEGTALWLTENIRNYDGVNGNVSLDSDCEGSKIDVIMEQIKNGVAFGID